MKAKITVTESDILSGQKGERRCPAAIALTRQFPSYEVFATYRVLIFNNGDRSFIRETPPQLKAFMEMFDEDEAPLYPVDFEIDDLP